MAVGEDAVMPVAHARNAARHPHGRKAGLVRGVLAERVTISTELDPFLSLRALSSYSGLSVRTLRGYLTDPSHPLPCYKVGGKVLVRRSEFDAWIANYRHRQNRDVSRVVDDLLASLATKPPRPAKNQSGAEPPPTNSPA